MRSLLPSNKELFDFLDFLQIFCEPVSSKNLNENYLINEHIVKDCFLRK